MQRGYKHHTLNEHNVRLPDNDFVLMSSVLEHYEGSVFVGCFEFHGLNWGLDNPMAWPVFWQPEAHPEGSNYFVIYLRDGKVWIANGINCTKHVWNGIRLEDGTIRYSSHRHDYVSDDEGNAVDGGIDYCRQIGRPDHVLLEVKDGVLTPIEKLVKELPDA